MQALQNLTFMVSLLDKVSGPAGAMLKTMDSVTNRIQAGYRKIGYGVAGVAGTGYALDSMLAPMKEMQSGLGELKSLDVTDDVLQNMTKTALAFSTQYGESATDFVHSAYQIQSAIAGLVGNELPAFTQASAILAKATKGDMQTITDYVGTMYSINQTAADEMGRANWIEKLAGQTAVAVNIFKAEGNDFAEAFQQLGAIATSKGLKLEEQLGVIGTLKGAYKAENAGTMYRSFLEKVFEAQDKLGLKFTDSKNHMLPMIEILTKIKGKYGDLSDEAKSFEVSKAFGKSPEAMALITDLIKNIDGLQGSIEQVGDKNAFERAKKMAEAMTMPWDKAAQGVNNLKIILGTQLLPQINAFFDKINRGIATLQRWNDLFPELSHAASLAVLGVFGLIAGVSALSIAMGIGTLAAGGFAVVMAVLTSPITLAVAAIAAAAYAVYDFVMYSRQLMNDYQVFEKIFSGWEVIKAYISGAIEYVMTAFNGLKEWLSQFNLWDFLLSGVDALIGKMNMIPGVNIDLGGAAAGGGTEGIPAAKGLNPNAGAAAGGGLGQKISNASNSNSKSIGQVTINNYESKKSISQLVDDVMMAGG